MRSNWFSTPPASLRGASAGWAALSPRSRLAKADQDLTGGATAAPSHGNLTLGSQFSLARMSEPSISFGGGGGFGGGGAGGSW